MDDTSASGTGVVSVDVRTGPWSACVPRRHGRERTNAGRASAALFALRLCSSAVQKLVWKI